MGSWKFRSIIPTTFVLWCILIAHTVLAADPTWQRVYEGLSGGVRRPLFTGGMGQASPTLVDIDGDKRLDLFVGNAGRGNGGAVFYFRNVGTTNVPVWSLVSEDYNNMAGGGRMYPMRIAAADLDGNGSDEVLIQGHPYYSFPGQMAVYNGQTGEEVGSYWNPGTINIPVLDDFEGDGIKDIILTGINNDVSGSGPFTGFVARFQGTNVWGEAPSNVHENTLANGSHLYYAMFHTQYGFDAHGSAPFALDRDNDNIKEALVFCGGEGLQLVNTADAATIWFLPTNAISSADILRSGTNALIIAGGAILPGLTNGLIQAVTFAGAKVWDFALNGFAHGVKNGVQKVYVRDLDEDGQPEILALLNGRILVLDTAGNQVGFLDTGIRDGLGLSVDFVPTGSGYNVVFAASNSLASLSWSPAGLTTNWQQTLPDQLRCMIVRDMGSTNGWKILLAMDADRAELRNPENGNLASSLFLNGGRAYAVEVADLNGDGYKEVIIGSQEGKGLLYAFDQGGHRLWVKKIGTEFYRTWDHSCPRFADLDGDGTNEMCLVANIYGGFERYKNSGLEGDQIRWRLVAERMDNLDQSDPGLGYFMQICFADINNDGKQELFVGSDESGISYFTNAGTAYMPAFGLAQTNYAGLEGENFLAPTFADMTGDGKLDLIVGRWNGEVIWSPNTGTANVPSWGGWYYLPNVRVDEFAIPTAGDINGDGKLDVVVGDYLGKVTAFLNSGSTTSPFFENAYTDHNLLGIDNGADAPYSDNPRGVSLCVGDLNNDARLDLLTVDVTGSCHLFTNSGSPIIPVLDFPQTHIEETVSPYSNLVAATLCDINADGRMDMFLGDTFGRVSCFTNKSRNQPLWSLQTASYAGLSLGSFAAPAFCDLNGNCTMDMVVGGRYGRLTFLENIGTRSNAVWTAGIANWMGIDVGYDAVPAFCDIDRDGDYDLFIGNELGTIWFYRNTGTPMVPNFELVTQNYNDIDVGWRSSPTFADIDGDGNSDLFVGEQNGGVSLWRWIVSRYSQER